MKVYPFSRFPPLFRDHQEAASGKEKKGCLNDALFCNDAAFDWLYPEHFQLMSLKHWTPLAIARQAAAFLATPGAKILDIGSGIGKFCLAGAYHFPDSYFCGVEQRHELVHYAQVAREYAGLSNVNFVHANITQVNFGAFDHFYFYNAFYENIDPANSIDDSIELSVPLFNYYNQYLRSVLDKTPPGTRLVTYQSFEEEVPPGFCLSDTTCGGLMKMWIKE